MSKKRILQVFFVVIYFLAGTVIFNSCRSTIPDAPDGPKYPVVFYGTTQNQNPYAKFVPSVTTAQNTSAMSVMQTGTLDVLVLMVDTKDFRFGGNDAARTAYRDSILNNYSDRLNAYWREASFSNLGITVEVPDRIVQMPGAFRDYFNEDFIAARITSRGLVANLTPNLELTEPSGVNFEIHDRFNRYENVQIVLPVGSYTQAAIVDSFNTALNAIRGNWAQCVADGNEIQVRLLDGQVTDGSFIRVTGGTNRELFGFLGPAENRGQMQTTFIGASVPGGFPVTLNGTEVLELTVRNRSMLTRDIEITLPAGTFSKNELQSLILTELNSDILWVGGGNSFPDRVELGMLEPFTSGRAAIYLRSGQNLQALGLDGPRRRDGVVLYDSRLTVRGSRTRIVEKALTRYMEARVEEEGIPLEGGNVPSLDLIFDEELRGFDSYLVLFVDQLVNIPPIKRAGASSSGYYNVTLEEGTFFYTRQLQAGFMIGPGYADWEVWAHELGHNLSFWDIYYESTHNDQLDQSFDYQNNWSLMDRHVEAPHPDAWHKSFFSEWIPNSARRTVPFPNAAQTETSRFILTPLEHDFSNYVNLGGSGFPPAQIVEIELGEGHYALLANRQPGTQFSQELPGAGGDFNVPTAPNPGGLLISDIADPWRPELFRTPVQVLSPHGNDYAASLTAGQNFDFSDSTVYPRYDGITIDVTDVVNGPPGLPPALDVVVRRGPGDFVELEIRPWGAPWNYGTPDIWIDWPGNGTEDYSETDPPDNNGDETHWSPDGSVTNTINVRVHNRGTVTAENVVVKLLINLPMGMGDAGTFQPLGESDSLDVPAGSFTDFQFPWNPTEAGHTCLRAEIKTFTGPFGDRNLNNNSAQENIGSFAFWAGSPYQPYELEFQVSNDYPVEQRIEILPTGLLPGMDLELETAYLEMGPKEERMIKGRLLLDHERIHPNPERRKKPYDSLGVNLHAFRYTADAHLPFGGISMEIKPGYKSTPELKGLFRIEKGDLPRDRDTLPGFIKQKLAEYDQLVKYYRKNKAFPEEYLKRIENMRNPIVLAVAGLQHSGEVNPSGDDIHMSLITGKKPSEGSAAILPNGQAMIALRRLPRNPGMGKAMLYYWGERLAASHLWVEEVIIP